MLTKKPSAKLLWLTKDPEKQIAKLGRTVKKSSHLEVLDHIYASFHLVIDRGTAHEIMKIAPNCIEEGLTNCQLRGRNEAECTFIEPLGLSQQQHRLWYMPCQVANDHYLALIDDGIDLETASSVLPNSLKTDLIVTGSFNDWSTWLNRQAFASVAYMISQILRKHAPKMVW